MTTLEMITNLEYMDITSNDKDLHCNYCNNPINDPVSTSCNHTHRGVCIENQSQNSTSNCAKPICENNSITKNDLTSVNDGTLLNMLDRLDVKCSACGTLNIQPGVIENHATNSCSKVTVRCSAAADLKCPWTGSNEQLKQHVLVCAYEQLRPILTELIQDNRQLKVQIQQMSENDRKHDTLYIKELEETNQRLNKNIEQLNAAYLREKAQLKELQTGVQQLKALILQSKSQINALRTDIDFEKEDIKIIGENCRKRKLQINELHEQLNAKQVAYTYQNTDLELSLSKCQNNATIDLSKQRLLDCDIEIIIKQALMTKQCTRLDLGYNALTSKGASLIADVLKMNTTLEELELHHNTLLDIGVQALAEALSSKNSTLKALGLGCNGITDQGAENLAEMLKTNRSITWLALAGNKISDYGVKLLADTLAHQNTSLLVLSLHVNKSIGDASVDTVIDMLQYNKSLKKLWMQDCSLSDDGKLKLRNATRTKQGCLLYML